MPTSHSSRGSEIIPFSFCLLLFSKFPSIAGWSGISAKSRKNHMVTLPSSPHFSEDHLLSGNFQLGRSEFIIQSLFSTGAIMAIPFASSNAMVTDPKTGVALPEPGEIEEALPKDWSSVENPLESDSTNLMSRLDSMPDSVFYSDPRFVEHVDDQAVQSMTSYITNEAIPNKENVAVLDLCSSWTSHIDLQNREKPMRVSGLGMNSKELAKNPVLKDWMVRDLNENPTLPYDDSTFDVVLCQLSIDYITRPLEVLKEAGRVLKPGGTVHIIFSNRLFLSKVRKKAEPWTCSLRMSDPNLSVVFPLHQCS